MQAEQGARPQITAVICAWNEAENISYVLKHTAPYVDEMLVVDGHSKDKTREIAEAHGARVVLDNKKGKGDAICVGIEKAKGDIIVFVDADCSHNPHDIPALVDPILMGVADHVTGSRILGGSEELHGDFGKFMRRFGSDIITMGINLRYGVGLTDSQNGFRALRTDIARKLDLKEEITTIEQEMIIKTLSLGARMAEVPTREFARRAGDSSFNVPTVAPRYVYTWLKYLVTQKPPPRAIRPGYSQYDNPKPWWRRDARIMTTDNMSIAAAGGDRKPRAPTIGGAA